MNDRILVKARAYLNDGKVLVLRTTAASAEFAVQGSDPTPYVVGESGGHWTCTCPARVEVCAHIQACKFIWKSQTDRPKIFKTDADLGNFFAQFNLD